MNAVTGILRCFRHLPIPVISFVAEHGTSVTVAVQIKSNGPSTKGYGFNPTGKMVVYRQFRLV